MRIFQPCLEPYVWLLPGDGHVPFDRQLSQLHRFVYTEAP